MSQSSRCQFNPAVENQKIRGESKRRSSDFLKPLLQNPMQVESEQTLLVEEASNTSNEETQKSRRTLQLGLIVGGVALGAMSISLFLPHSRGGVSASNSKVESSLSIQHSRSKGGGAIGTCFLEGLDYRFSASNFFCGFAPVVKVVTSQGVDRITFASTQEVDSRLHSAKDCQKLCTKQYFCDVYSFETKQGVSYCYMKKAHSGDASTGVLGGDYCNEFMQIWPSCPGGNCAIARASGYAESCILEGIDYADYVGKCGYPNTFKLVTSPAVRNPCPSFLNGECYSTSESQLSSPEDCQKLCREDEKCEVFSYEYDIIANAGRHDCYFKQKFDNGRCKDFFVPWPGEVSLPTLLATMVQSAWTVLVLHYPTFLVSALIFELCRQCLFVFKCHLVRLRLIREVASTLLPQSPTTTLDLLSFS
eukprot:g55972.t1